MSTTAKEIEDLLKEFQGLTAKRTVEMLTGTGKPAGEDDEYNEAGMKIAAKLEEMVEQSAKNAWFAACGLNNMSLEETESGFKLYIETLPQLKEIFALLRA